MTKVGISILRLVVAATVMIAVAACASGSSSPTAASTSSSPAPAAASDSPTAAASDSPTSVPSGGGTISQTDTDWGRIWDRLPAGFPTIPGATPDEDAAGPASAVLVVDGVDAKTVATSLQASLQKAGYTTISSADPLEDGSVVLDMNGKAAGCMLQVRATPTGSVTTVSILYGAACPNS